jgi:hypothetical protein
MAKAHPAVSGHRVRVVQVSYTVVAVKTILVAVAQVVMAQSV